MDQKLLGESTSSVSSIETVERDPAKVMPLAYEASEMQENYSKEEPKKSTPKVEGKTEIQDDKLDRKGGLKTPDVGKRQVRFSLRNSGSVRRSRTMSQVEADLARHEDLMTRVNLVEHQLGKFMFSHTGMSLNEAFSYFDKDRSAALEKAEIKHILNQTDSEYTESELDMLMNRYDEDNSGGITIDEFQRRYHVERDLLLKYVKEKEDSREGFAELPIIGLFFVIFILLLYGHDFTSTKYSATRGALEGVLPKLNKVTTTDKLWTWLEEDFLDYAFVQTDALDQELPSTEWGYISSFNKYVSDGVYLSQTRSQSDECVLFSTNNAYGDKCYPTSKLSSTTFGPGCHGHDKNCSYAPDSDQLFTATLDYRVSKDKLKSKIQDLKKEHWIDKNTAWLDVKYYLLNLNLGTYTKVVLKFEFARGGLVVPTYRTDAIIVNPYAGASIVWAVVDAIWIIFQIYTAVHEGRQLREDGCKEYSKGVAGTWNLLDWTQIVVTLTVAGLWFTMVYYLADLLAMPNPETHNFLTSIGTVEKYSVWMQILSVINLFILVIRFFKGFSAQPRLRIIVDSIVGAAVDLAHWIVIFGILLLTFSMIAYFLFGHRIETFSDAASAVFQLFRGWIVANAIPFYEFFEMEPSWTVVWYLLFTPMMIFVLQKMVLGIVLGAFIATRNKNKDARTLWSQTRDFCVDWNAQCKKLMKLSDIIHVLEDPTYKLSNKERVNLMDILGAYLSDKDLTDKQNKYAENFCLSIMEEFFANYDKIRDPDIKVRTTNAYARTTQLNDDFLELHEKLDKLEDQADHFLEALRETFNLS